MAIYKRGKFYWFKFSFLGKTYQASTRLKNEREAAKIESKLKTDLALGVYGLQPMKPGPTFKDYAESFKEYVRHHSADKPATIDAYFSRLRRLLKFKPLANCRLNFIDEALVEQYIQYRRKAVTIKTLNNELGTLRRALKVARKPLKLMQATPEITLLSGANQRTFVLSYPQEAAYLVACSDILRDAAILMLDTGIRVGVCTRVQWADLIEDSTRLIVRKTKSEKADHVILLSRRCREMLANRRLFRLDGEAYVFPGRFDHIGISALEDYHLAARTAARLKDGSELPPEFLIHSLRHTFATRFGELAENAFIVKDALGHADIQMSQKYVHVRTEASDRAFERLDAMNQLMRGEETTGDKIGDSAKSRPVKP